LGLEGIPVLYKKVNVELIVVADEADAVIAELNRSVRALGNAEEIGTRAYDGGRRDGRWCYESCTQERECGLPRSHLT
jgi:hypothetical protein